jgi:hypothetical protein
VLHRALSKIEGIAVQLVRCIRCRETISRRI